MRATLFGASKAKLLDAAHSSALLPQLPPNRKRKSGKLTRMPVLPCCMRQRCTPHSPSLRGCSMEHRKRCNRGAAMREPFSLPPGSADARNSPWLVGHAPILRRQRNVVILAPDFVASLNAAAQQVPSSHESAPECRQGRISDGTHQVGLERAAPREIFSSDPGASYYVLTFTHTITVTRC